MDDAVGIEVARALLQSTLHGDVTWTRQPDGRGVVCRSSGRGSAPYVIAEDDVLISLARVGTPAAGWTHRKADAVDPLSDCLTELMGVVRRQVRRQAPAVRPQPRLGSFHGH